MMKHTNKKESIEGCILGTAVGDALGLPYEGLSKQRQQKIFSDNEIRHRFLCGQGMISDDTEHTCMVAQSLCLASGDSRKFLRDFAWRLRLWLFALPAGVGFGTLRAILKLWLGVPEQRSGVFSAGNGPAMRSAIIGVCYGEQPDTLVQLVRASTRITHTDPKAELGALAVALAAYMASQHSFHPDKYVRQLHTLIQQHCSLTQEMQTEFFTLLDHMVGSITADHTTDAFAASLGLTTGVSGYIYHTLPVVLHAWFRHPQDYHAAVAEIIGCGGDTDTTAAIVGAIVGAGVGKAGIPQAWLANLKDWPRSIRWMEELADRLHHAMLLDISLKPSSLPAAGIVLRNLLFLGIVLIHGIRRLFPPY